MGFLLDKILEQKTCGFADLRKTSCEAISPCGKRAESCGKEKLKQGFPQSPQTVRTLKPTPHNVFHKSASPHGSSDDFEKSKSEEQGNVRNEIRAYQFNLVRGAVQSGVFNHGIRLHEKEVSALVPPSDFRDVARCDPEELQAWADALAIRAVRYCGKVPRGWDKVAHCAHCGPVYSFAAGDCLGCPWCELRRAGKWFPVPTT